MPHNVAVFTDSSASKSVYVGQTITDAATTYDVLALEPGTYSSGATCIRT